MREHNSNTGIFLLSTVILLIGIGFGFLYSASSFIGEKFYNNQFHYLLKQSLFFFVGVFFFLAAYFVKLDFYKKNIKVIVILTIVLLLITLIPGIGKEVSGGRRWINLGFLQFQPSELAKIVVIFYLSFVLANKDEFIKDFYKGILPPLILVGFIAFLILAENGFSTTMIIILVSLILFFLSGIRLITLGMLLIVGGLLSSLLIFFAQYRVKRLFAFLNPWDDPLGSGWQPIQSMKCFAFGGGFGRGFGESVQKVSNLPDSHNDYIFAIIAEEGGAFFAIILIILFVVFSLFGLKIAKDENDKGNKELFLLSAGITSMIFIQAMSNIGVVIGLLPSTGITLPFISYGGSSFVILIYSIGILFNIGHRKRGSLYGK